MKNMVRGKNGVVQRERSLPSQTRLFRKQRAIISSRSPTRGFGYNRIRGKWHRAYQVTEGRNHNCYIHERKVTPKFKPPVFIPVQMISGKLRSIQAGKEMHIVPQEIILHRHERAEERKAERIKAARSEKTRHHVHHAKIEEHVPHAPQDIPQQSYEHHIFHVPVQHLQTIPLEPLHHEGHHHELHIASEQIIVQHIRTEEPKTEHHREHHHSGGHHEEHHHKEEPVRIIHATTNHFIIAVDPAVRYDEGDASHPKNHGHSHHETARTAENEHIHVHHHHEKQHSHHHAEHHHKHHHGEHHSHSHAEHHKTEHHHKSEHNRTDAPITIHHSHEHHDHKSERGMIQAYERLLYVGAPFQSDPSSGGTKARKRLERFKIESEKTGIEYKMNRKKSLVLKTTAAEVEPPS